MTKKKNNEACVMRVQYNKTINVSQYILVYNVYLNKSLERKTQLEGGVRREEIRNR